MVFARFYSLLPISFLTFFLFVEAPAAYVTNQPEKAWWKLNSIEPEIAKDKLITQSLDTKIRHVFIRKVYALLSVMLTV